MLKLKEKQSTSSRPKFDVTIRPRNCFIPLGGCGQTKIQGYDPFLCWMIHKPNKKRSKIHYISWALVDGLLIQGWHRKIVNPGQKASCMKVSMAKLDPGFEITHVNPALHFWCYGCLQPCEAPLNWVDGRTLRLQNGRIVSLGCHLPWRGVLGPGFIWFSWVRAQIGSFLTWWYPQPSKIGCF